MMMKKPIAAAAAACKVWTRSSTPCVFGRSVYDLLRTNSNELDSSESSVVAPQLSQNYHCDRMLVDFEEGGDGSVFLAPSRNKVVGRKPKSEKSQTRKYSGIPLGRARDCPTLTQRAFEDDKFDRRRWPFVKHAVVGMVFDTEEKDEGVSSVLITRRPSYMRSFPGAFVFPGGNVDDDDESLEHALSREIFEETGLIVSEDSWKLECLWESIYPTQLPPIEENEKSTTIHGSDDKSQPGGAIKAHHIVCYYSGQVQKQFMSNSSLNLCQEEVDGAVWMSPDNIQDLLEATALIEGEKNSRLPEILSDQNIFLQTSNSNTTNLGKDIALSDLAGIYPRVDKSSSQSYGMAQGSLFALEEFVRNRTTRTTHMETE